MAQRLADPWADILPESHREALFDSLSILTDDFLSGPEQPKSLLISYLPPRYIPRYDDLFCRRFFATFLTVGYKLAQPLPPAPLLSCVAEELACHALISPDMRDSVAKKGESHHCLDMGIGLLHLGVRFGERK